MGIDPRLRPAPSTRGGSECESELRSCLVPHAATIEVPCPCRVNYYLSEGNFVQFSPPMTLGERLKSLRTQLGLSQEAVGAQGFVSSPGWIKIENGQRSPSEKLLEKLCGWLVEDKYLRSGAASTLKEELLVLKYLGSRSPFVRELAKSRAKQMPGGGAALLAETPGGYKAKRGRPPGMKTSAGVALVAETPGAYKTKRRKQ